MTNALNRPRSKFRSPWLWAVAGLLVFLIAIFAAAPQSYPGGSTYGKALGDYSQWYAFMQQQDRPIRRWQKPYSQLEGQGQTLIQISDSLAQAEIIFQTQEVLKWVERGNTLIQLSWAGQFMGAPFRSDLHAQQGLVRIETSLRYKIGTDKEKDEVAEVKDAFGSAIWSHRRGKGQVILSTYPWIAANAYAQQAGNFRVLEALATRQNGPIWIDEWLHGHRDLGSEPEATDREEQSPWAYLSRQPIAVMAGQGVVLMLVLLWGKNQRFGALIRFSEPTRNSSEQYIQALADTLEANEQTEYVLSMLGQSFRQRLQTQLGMGGMGAETALTDEAIAQQWSLTTGRPSQELLKLLEQTQRKKRLSDRALLSWVRNSDSILQALTV
jgi:Domain of unknown function (DUF4350)